jgi:predicted metal-dependent hydrolase
VFARARAAWISREQSRLKRVEQENAELLAKSAQLDRRMAKQKLVSRLSQLAAEHGFVFNRVSIRNQRTRWGSCSVKDNISLNAKLVLLSDELMDYVLLHELVHTRVRNHSKAFWSELGKYVPQPKAMAATLRKRGLGLL